MKFSQSSSLQFFIFFCFLLCCIPIIIFKQCLHRVSSQKEHIFSHLISVLILPFLIDVFSIKIVFLIFWFERQFSFLFFKFVPLKVSKPFMRLDFLWSFMTQSLLRLSLDAFIDKISRCCRPVLRNFSFLNHDLFCKYMISYFSSCST